MDYKSIIGIPIEKERAQVTQESINKHFEDLSRNITGIPARFIFNADESGFQDFVDSSEVHVIVPSSYHEETINVPTDRSQKRATMLATIAADGSFLKPLVIMQRKTYENDIMEAGYNLVYKVIQLL